MPSRAQIALQSMLTLVEEILRFMFAGCLLALGGFALLWA